MVAALRSYGSAGLAITTAGLIAVAPAVVRAPEPTAVHLAQRLTAGESLMSVPLNLFQALVNIPANEIHALDTLSRSLFYSGPWFVGSPTNIWGEDPGDLGHFESVIQLLVPFPELSGAGHEGDFFYPGLGQQLSMLANVEIPVHPSCASLDCLPAMPTSPITGFTWIDQTIWSLLIATGLQKFPLIENWFQVPFSDMMDGNSYYFDPNSPGMINSGLAHDGFYWEGSRTLEQLGLNPEDYPNIDPDTPLMPWAGTSYAMDFDQPFINFFNSLMQPFDPDKFVLPDLVEFGRAMQAVLASMLVAFNPFVPGSPFCPGPCLLPDPAGDLLDPATWSLPSYYVLAKGVGDLWPGNPVIDQWLAHYDEGTANISTPEIIDYEAWLWRLGTVLLDLKNPLPPDAVIDTTGFLPSVEQIHDFLGDYLYNIADNSGIIGPFDVQGLWDAVFDVTAT
ncbi:hypothetical protein [Mycolicibacter sinensis]|uniref:PE-PPE domain-containing protein n=1 Tax=Mycolicibacter sinensis (strain JDM601) TaxID=875328 RepID=A0A1A2E650_MYCSD|nr:hypothetical protein [Mycolicibacter sinensis]OBF99579.1 hypothetical protein A5772_12175 [Mycolicibacter sinensis]OBG09025.1 hypothetical protein A5771_02110 [Mycolicibacter sinensis]